MTGSSALRDFELEREFELARDFELERDSEAARGEGASMVLVRVRESEGPASSTIATPAPKRPLTNAKIPLSLSDSCSVETGVGDDE